MYVTNRVLGRLSRIEDSQLGAFQSSPRHRWTQADAAVRLGEAVAALSALPIAEADPSPDAGADLARTIDRHAAQVRLFAAPAGYPLAEGIAGSLGRLTAVGVSASARYLIGLHIQALNRVVHHELKGDDRTGQELLIALQSAVERMARAPAAI